MPNYTEEFLALCRSITDKRPKTVIDHILEHGQITTEELKAKYGYNHAPRAARDVRERGIQLETIRVKDSEGRNIGAYRFADPSKMKFRKFDGRTLLSKELKDKLIETYGCKCFIYLETMDERELQIDHRVPYEISGDIGELRPENFMLLCGSANRTKSWSCENCENWINTKDSSICISCYWAYPEKYEHIAMRQIRRIDLMWEGSEIKKYEKLKSDAQKSGSSLPDFVKSLLEATSRQNK